MVATKIKALIVEDNTGIESKIPIILTDHGIITSVVDYILYLKLKGKSISKINHLITAICKLLYYLDANKNIFDNPQILFKTFTARLYTGTISDSGLDSSGLYWLPLSQQTANKYITELTQFFDHITKSDKLNINHLRDASKHEERLNYAAWYYKNKNKFLGHIKDSYINKAAKKAREIVGRKRLKKVNSDIIAFPEKEFIPLYNEGFKPKEIRAGLRDKLILLLMHFGGLRESEALLLWSCDVYQNKNYPDEAQVRVYNETNGSAPFNWRSRDGHKTRKAYLKHEYGLIPRIDQIGTEHIGWKGQIVDSEDNYIQVQFFPSYISKLFLTVWKTYIRYRAQIACNHPYAFISFSKDNIGEPYTLNAFNYNYRSALKKIKLKSRKELGTTPHSHRHRYIRRLDESNLDPYTIKKCAHHSSLNSQEVYKGKGQKWLTNKLNDATLELENIDKNKNITQSWKELCEYGFKDIDSNELFTGIAPKFLR